MNNVKTYKKNLVIFALSLGIGCAVLRKPQDGQVCVVTEECEAFGVYSNGLVYIGDHEYLMSLEGIDESNDVLVEDLRCTDDPNMKILNSYVVDNRRQMKEIIRLLCIYEQLYPSKWDRSPDAMYREWVIHNLLYYFHYQTNRTVDVDLNNKDEDLYNKVIFRLIK